MLEHVAERATVPDEPARKRLAGVQLDGVQAAAAARPRASRCRDTGSRPGHLDRARRRREANRQDVAKRMGGIGRHEEHPRPALRFDHGSRRGAGGFSHATLAAIQNEVRMGAGA